MNQCFVFAAHLSLPLVSSWWTSVSRLPRRLPLTELQADQKLDEWLEPSEASIRKKKRKEKKDE
jgi:hypothetical protein